MNELGKEAWSSEMLFFLNIMPVKKHHSIQCIAITEVKTEKSVASF